MGETVRVSLADDDAPARLRWRLWGWYGRWRSRRVFRAARRWCAAHGTRWSLEGAWGSCTVRLRLVVDQRGPRLRLRIRACVQPPMADPRPPIPPEPQWEIMPASLTVVRGSEPEGIAWVAGPLHACAGSTDRCWASPNMVIYETAHLARAARWLPRLLRAAVEVLSQLRASPMVDDALAALAGGASDPAVRRRSVTLLLQRAETPEQRRRAAIRALVDPDPRVQLAGAMQVGALGRPALERLVLDDGLDIDRRHRALLFLWSRFRDPALVSTMVKVACDGPSALGRVAVEALRSSADPAAVAGLTRIRDGQGPAAGLAREALGARGCGRRGALSMAPVAGALSPPSSV